ncbi:regulator of microtubule dynamics protein 3 isoform X1 [Gadus macrocephalus]|uniref:regulator of microtubule dynamics protein 3 isoform X1 n=1 Tax=Gadus macrocephalus TaxID=80720 RepID=UPI0028CB2F57|nr:regulator of microtubule dynamics protein 3 isoform X1 [Gadus macrocephalus]
MLVLLGRKGLVGLAVGATAGLGLIALIIYQEVRRRRSRCQQEVLQNAPPPPQLVLSSVHLDAEEAEAQQQALAAVEEAVRLLPPAQQGELRAQLDQVLSCVSSLRSEVAELRGGLHAIALQIIQDVKRGVEDSQRARRRRPLRERSDSQSSSSVYFTASQGAASTQGVASEAGYSTAYADSDYTDRETDREEGEGGGEGEESEEEEDQSCATVLTLRQEESQEDSPEEEEQEEQEEPVKEVLSGELALLLAQSDVLQTGDARLRADGLGLLQAHRTQYGDSRDFLWRLARAYSAVHAATHDPEQRSTIAQQGRDEAESVLRKNDLDADCHIRFAVLAGLTSQTDSMHSKLKSQRILKEHLDRALALRDDLPLAFYLLGSWSYQVATLGWLERKAAAALYDQPPKASLHDALGHFMKVRRRRPHAGVAQEAERVGWSPGGRRFDPRLLLAECGGVPERDASPRLLLATPCVVDSAVVCVNVYHWVRFHPPNLMRTLKYRISKR